MSFTDTVTTLARLWAPPLFPASSWYFALTTSAAAVLALHAAYSLELDSPGSAMTTVLIVSSPLHGMVLSKGIWRLVGTLIGVLVSIVLIAIAAQAPALFFLWLGLWLWLALCTFVSSYQRYFRAYAAVLAGYTLSVVAVPAAEHPDQIFNLATSRVAAVTIGIITVAVVKSVFATEIGHSRLRPVLRGALLETLQFASQVLDRMEDMPGQRRALAERLMALDPLIHAAANESAETALQAPAVRLFVIVLLNVVTLVGGIHHALTTADAAGALPCPLATARAALRDLMRDLGDATRLTRPDGAELIASARHLLAEMSAQLSAQLAPEHDPAALSHLALAIRLEDIAEELAHARGYLIDIERGRSGREVTPITYHRDTGLAIANASRGFVATLAGGAFWIVTAWPSGASMMLGLLPTVVLLGTAERPDLAAFSFFRGLALSGLVAFLCEFFVLTQIEGFPLLALTISVVVTIAALISTLRKHSGSAPAFMIFFAIFLAPTNPMHYDPAGQLNTIMAVTLGTAFAVVAYRILWPVNPDRVVRGLMRTIVNDLCAFSRRQDTPPISLWESRMYDRLGRLSTRLAQSPRRQEAIEGGLAALQIGRELMRARRTLSTLHMAPPLQASITRSGNATHRLLGASDRAAGTMAEAARALFEAATAAPSDVDESLVPVNESGAVLRTAASLQSVSELLACHRRFFDLTVLDGPGAS